MALRSFKEVEQEVNHTLPNDISVARGVGGVVLGFCLATGSVEPTTAFAAASALAISDLEGSLITLTNRVPRVQNALRIIPSTLGRKLDPVMDKVFGVFVILGGTIGGQIPLWQGAGILAAEVATSGATLAATYRGEDPETTKTGKFGMVARCGVIGANFGVAAVASHTGTTPEALATGTDILAATAIGLGGISCGQIVHRYLLNNEQAA